MVAGINSCAAEAKALLRLGTLPLVMYVRKQVLMVAATL